MPTKSALRTKKLSDRERLAAKLCAARGTESQPSLATRSRISEITINQIENGLLPLTALSIETIVHLAIATDNNPKEWLSCAGKKIDQNLLELNCVAIKHGAWPREFIRQSERTQHIYRQDKVCKAFHHLSHISESLKSIYWSLEEVCRYYCPTVNSIR